MEQIRSMLIVKKLGWQVWWNYVVLFASNQCHDKKLIDHCVRKTMVELKIAPVMIG